MEKIKSESIVINSYFYKEVNNLMADDDNKKQKYFMSADLLDNSKNAIYQYPSMIGNYYNSFEKYKKILNTVSLKTMLSSHWKYRFARNIDDAKLSNTAPVECAYVYVGENTDYSTGKDHLYYIRIDKNTTLKEFEAAFNQTFAYSGNFPDKIAIIEKKNENSGNAMGEN